MGGKAIWDNKGLARIQMIVIVVVVLIAAIGGGLYYFLVMRARAPVTIKVVAIAHAAPGIQELANNFMEAHPEIKIECILLDWETGRDRQLHDMATGAGEFDVYMWDCIYTGAFGPHCYTLDELKSSYPDAETFTQYRDFIQSIDSRYAFWNGKRIGYIVCANVMAMFYRKDLFDNPTIKAQYATWIQTNLDLVRTRIEDSGLDTTKIPMQLKVPTVLEELLPTAMFFTRTFNPNSPTEIGNCIMAMKTHTIHWEYCWLFAQWRRSPQGLATLGPVTPPYGDLFTSTAKLAFDPAVTDMGVRMLKYFKYLTDCQTAPMETEWSQCMENFGTGKAAMWAGSWASCFIDFIEKAPTDYPTIAGKVGVAPSPGVGADGTWQVGVSRDSKHAKEAWLFIQYMMTSDSMKIAWTVSSSFPARTSVIQDLSSQYPVFTTFLTALEDPSTRNYVPENPQLEDSIAKWVTDYIGGAVDAETAITSLTTEWKQILGIP